MQTDLTVGLHIVDTQHAELVALTGALLEATREGVCGTALLPALEHLQEKVVVHFRTEEGLMLLHGYTGYAEHKSCHDAFVASFLGLKRVMTEGHEPVADRDRVEVIDHWLELHINGYDRHMARYLKEHGES